MDPNFPTPTPPTIPIEPTPIVPEPVTQIPVVQPAPVVPPTPKKVSGVLIAGLILLFVSVLALVGYFLYQNNQSRINVSTPIVLPSPSPIATTDPTADWQTYVNSQYKYSIKYPSNMTLEQITNDPFYPSYVNFKNGNNFFNVRVREYSVEQETEEIRSQTEGHVVADLIKNEALQFNGVTARLLEYKFESNNGSTLIIPSGKNVIVINAPSEMFDQILSTFQFTDVQSTPSVSPTALPL